MTKDKKQLEKIFGKINPNRPKCNFLKCFAGSGVSGTGECFLGGNPQDANCEKFIDEKEELERWRLEEGK